VADFSGSGARAYGDQKKARISEEVRAFAIGEKLCESCDF